MRRLGGNNVRQSAALVALILGIVAGGQAISSAQEPPGDGTKATRRPDTGTSGAEEKPETAISRSLTGKAAAEMTPLPEIGYEDLVHLVRTARRSFVEKHAGREERPATYHPPALEGVKAIIHATLRRKGRLLAEAESPVMQVVDAAAAAGTLLAQAALEKEVKIRGDGEDYGLELEILGPRMYLDAKYDVSGTWSPELLHSFEPGAEGIGVTFQGRSAWTRPSEVITLNLSPDLALQAAEAACGLKHIHKLRFEKDIRHFRFRAYHLWQPDELQLPIVLHRGERLMPAEPPDAAGFDAAIRRVGEYLHYRQNSDGWFSQQYLPSTDRYGEGDSPTVQMHAMLGLARYARLTRDSEILADVRKGLSKTAFFLMPISRLVELPKEEGEPPAFEDAGLLLAFPGHEDYLEITSLMLLSMVEMEPFWPADQAIRQAAKAKDTPTSGPAATTQPDASKLPPSPTFREAIIGMAECLMSSQRDDGAFFVPSKETTESAMVAQGGWVMLSLAKAHRARVLADNEPLRKRIERSIYRAMQFYGPRLESEIGPRPAAVFARGLVVAYAATNDARFSDTAFAVLDRFAAVQVTAESCPWPELHGAINARQLGLIGIDTAGYLIALSDGVLLAERVGDNERAERYRQVVMRGVRFVLQLEVSEAGCFYIMNKRDALAGLRVAPWDNRLRADTCAIGLECLMEARASLHGRASGSRQ